MNKVTNQERRRILELIEQGRLAGRSIRDVVDQIANELPQLPSENVAQVLLVSAEELRLEAAEDLAAAAGGATQIAAIMGEVAQTLGVTDLTLEAVYRILQDRAAQGDGSAKELLDKLERAMSAVSLGGEG
jgi:5,10-methenyltetrahydromethanopterin hydrogenase